MRRPRSSRILRLSATILSSSSEKPGVVLPVREEVAREHAGEHSHRGTVALRHRALLPLELVDGARALARDGLVGGDHDVLEAREVVQRLEGHSIWMVEQLGLATIRRDIGMRCR
jgi:hypothetical protein